MQQILQRSHHQFRWGGKGHVEQMPGRSLNRPVDPTGDALLTRIIELVPPAQGGGVVMGAGVHHPAAAFDVFGQIGVVLQAIEGELQHLHPRQPEAIPEGFHIGSDHPQIFSDQGQGTATIPLQLAQQ